MHCFAAPHVQEVRIISSATIQLRQLKHLTAYFLILFTWTAILTHAYTTCEQYMYMYLSQQYKARTYVMDIHVHVCGASLLQ